MSSPHFRFLHAGGLALDQPVGGFTEIPEPLESLLIDAPYVAAQRVFDAALEERVDFVALTGDLVDLARPTPRAIAFLLENFERLDAQGIAVYWAGGRLDPPQDWPAVARLPARIHAFPSVEPKELSHFRGSRPVANIVGRSWHGTTSVQVGEFKSDSDGLPTIVIAYGQADPARLVDQMVDYWALGGQAQRQSFGTTQRIIHYVGSPQGRSPEEHGPHGCAVVHIGGDRAIRTQFTPTDAVRWHVERVSIDEHATLAAVRQSLTDRMKQLRSETDSRPHLVTWKVSGGHHLAGPAARRDLAAEWEASLRTEFFMSEGQPGVWTHAVELEQPDLPQAWWEEESMLGDFLRNLHELAARGGAGFDLAACIPEHHRVPALAGLGQWSEDEHREILREAALTGSQLLGAGERES